MKSENKVKSKGYDNEAKKPKLKMREGREDEDAMRTKFDRSH